MLNTTAGVENSLQSLSGGWRRLLEMRNAKTQFSLCRYQKDNFEMT